VVVLIIRVEIRYIKHRTHHTHYKHRGHKRPFSVGDDSRGENDSLLGELAQFVVGADVGEGEVYFDVEEGDAGEKEAKNRACYYPTKPL